MCADRVVEEKATDEASHKSAASLSPEQTIFGREEDGGGSGPAKRVGEEEEEEEAKTTTNLAVNCSDSRRTTDK